jgi:hypothetical protein
LGVVTALCALLSACQPPGARGAHTVGPAVAADGAPPADATTSDPPAKDKLSPEVARAETDRILAEVARARNLEVTGSVQVDVVDRNGIREFAKESMYEHTTPEEMALLGRIQASLGVMPRGTDPEQVLLDLLEDGVLGFYDPKSKTLRIGDFVSKGMLSMVVGHEIAHGLQDMHFDLNRHQLPIAHDSDAETARRFVIEGGAQAAYLAWVSGERGLAAIDDRVLDAMGNQTLDMAALASPYPVLARSLQLPYADGTATIARLVRTGGWKAVDALYADLPTTSEQMLHLDKLLTREAAIVIRVDGEALARSLGGLQQVWHDTVGEAELLAMLADSAPSLTARESANGWGGDRLVALDRPTAPLPSPLVILATAWDTKADAIEFEKGFAQYLHDTSPRDHAIARRDDKVMAVVAIPKGIDHAKVLDAAWTATTFEPRARKRAAPKGTRG